MLFALTIDTRNAAFDELSEFEIARLLRQIANRLEDDHFTTDGINHIHDVNGNKVGQFQTGRTAK